MGTGALWVEARLVWGGDVLAVTHARPRGTLRLRDLARRLSLGPEELGERAELAIARQARGDAEPVLLLPTGEPAPFGTPLAFPVGRVTLEAYLVADDGPPPRATGDGRVAKGVALGAVIHATVLAMAILGRAPIGDEEASREAVLAGYVAAIEARAEPAGTAAPVPDLGEGNAARPKDGAAGGAAKEQGAAGNPSRTADGGRNHPTRGADRHAQRPSEERPETFGMIALLGGDRPGDRAGRSAFADFEGPGAMGSIFGARIEDAAGLAGLGLSGIGEGGGGEGKGVPLGLTGYGDGSGPSPTPIGLGSIGTLGHATGVGYAQGFGAAHGRLHGSHTARSPVLRCVEDPTSGCNVQVNGRLPPEAIQRVVRQSFGRLRACYEAGLLRDPSLEGRIAVKFVIDREGAVAMTSVDERSLPDASVAACVQRAYEAMSFPKPEGGIVTVVYPVVFSS